MIKLSSPVKEDKKGILFLIRHSCHELTGHVVCMYYENQDYTSSELTKHLEWYDFPLAWERSGVQFAACPNDRFFFVWFFTRTILRSSGPIITTSTHLSAAMIIS